MFIFDIDGTLSNAEHRIHYIKNLPNGEKVGSKHWDKFLAEAEDDPPIQSMVDLTQILSYDGNTITLSTGRRESQRLMTETWLAWNQVSYDHLIMRPTDDRRSDTIVKPAQLSSYFDAPHDVLIKRVTTIFEDRKRVTAAWRELGYHVCQVAEGDY